MVKDKEVQGHFSSPIATNQRSFKRVACFYGFTEIKSCKVFPPSSITKLFIYLNSKILSLKGSNHWGKNFNNPRIFFLQCWLPSSTNESLFNYIYRLFRVIYFSKAIKVDKLLLMIKTKHIRNRLCYIWVKETNTIVATAIL